MKRARLLTALFLLLFVVLGGWTAWWFFLASYAERLLAGAGSDTARPRLEYASAERFGFPFTVGLELADARLTGPVAAGAGRATTTRARLSARPWRPGDIALDLPDGLGFALIGATPADRVTGQAARGTGAFTGEPAQTLALDLQDIAVRPETAAPLRAARGRVEWRAPPAAPQEIAVGLADIALGPDALFGPEARLFEGAVRLHGPTPASTRPEAIARWRNAGGKVEVIDARIDWGALDLAARGEIFLDEAYRLAGQLRLEIENGVAAVERIESLGLLTPEGATAAKALMAFASLGGGDSAAAPLVFANGEARLGGIRVGRLAPVCACP